MSDRGGDIRLTLRDVGHDDEGPYVRFDCLYGEPFTEPTKLRIGDTLRLRPSASFEWDVVDKDDEDVEVSAA